MTLNAAQHTMTRTVLQFNLVLFALTAFFLNPRPTQTIGSTKSVLSDFTGLSGSAPDTDGSVLRGVYVEGVLDLPIVQQPADDPYYVSELDGEATQFSMASQYDNIGLLAHNTLSGKSFSKLEVGHEVQLVYGNGEVEYFVVTEVLRFQAMQPESVSSSFRNLDRNETLSAGEMFNRAYVGVHRLVFQTCIAAEGNVSWGRLFVIAMPRE
jgi:hypothetical protein